MAEHPFGHEPPGIKTGQVLAIVGILALFVVIALGLLHVARHAVLPNHAQVAARPGVKPPEPRLQPHPDADIAAERTQKQRMLSRYAWLGPSHRFARIPIQRAMQLYAQQHRAAHDAHAARKTSAAGTGR